MNFKKLLLVIFVLMIALVGCKNNANNKPEPEKDPDEGKEIYGISVDKDTIPSYIDIEEFDLSVIKVIVEYTDGSTRIMDLKEDMIDDETLEMLKKGITKRVTITYKDDYACTCNIRTVDFGADDPKLGDNDVIVMIRRDKENSKLVFSILSNVGLSSLQAQFKYDNTQLQLSKDIEIADISQEVRVNITDKYIQVLVMASNDDLLRGDVLVFSTKYEGNYRESNIEIDETNANRVLRFENGELIDVTDVNYCFSLK